MTLAENMKRLKTFQTLGDCDQARLVLEGSGIACSIRNEYAANTAAAGLLGSLSFAQPELWIIDESQEQDAHAILEQGSETK